MFSFPSNKYLRVGVDAMKRLQREIPTLPEGSPVPLSFIRIVEDNTIPPGEVRIVSCFRKPDGTWGTDEVRITNLQVPT